MTLNALTLALIAACAPLPEEAGGGPLNGTCDAAGYAALIGLNIAAVTLPADLEQRVITPGMAVTQDYRENRLNIVVDRNGVIQRIYCG